MAMQCRTIIKGTTVSWEGSFEDESGDPVDFSSGALTGQLRIRDRAGVDIATKDTNTGSDWTWTSQETGAGYWTFTTAETAALDVGLYFMDMIYTDTSTTPATKLLVGSANLEVNAPEVGPIS